MKRTLMLCVSALALAGMAVVSAFRETAQLAGAAVLRTCSWLRDFATGAVKVLNGGSGCIDLNPISIFASAKAFVLRLAKRERPQLTAGWRMCPST